jgi:hypothetical protein
VQQLRCSRRRRARDPDPRDGAAPVPPVSRGLDPAGTTKNFNVTANDRKALLLLAQMQQTRAGNFGLAMSATGNRPPQAYARSGGKALARLVRLGYAEWFRDLDRWGWRITPSGRQAARTEIEQGAA